MTIGLPNPDGDPSTIRAEILDVLAEIRKYRAAELRSLEFGLRYQSTLTDERLRDGLALMIQRTAFRYSIIYKKSHGTHFVQRRYVGEEMP